MMKSGEKMKKVAKWVKKRHIIIRNIVYVFFFPYCILKYRIRVDKFKEQGNRQYLILFNHQTAYDQFFVGGAFKGAVYYLASEDLFSNGWVSRLISWLVAPIPIKKQASDVRAVMNCIRVAREGGTIALAPEGNRTYSGKTEYINPAIASLAKKLGLPIAFFRIEGGYGVHPRWSDKVRRGKMHAYVSKVLEPEEFKEMSQEELIQIISDELYVNEGNSSGEFKYKNSAEYLERAMYVCPYCGLSRFESKENKIKCLKCFREIEYNADKTLEGVGFEFPFKYISEWYDNQCEFINQLNIEEYIDTPLYTDVTDVKLVIVYKKKMTISKMAEIKLFGDRIEIRGEELYLELKFDDISAVTVLGKNKLNIYYKDELYQLKGDKRFNALKYVNIFYRSSNILRGNKNGKFLGL